MAFVNRCIFLPTSGGTGTWTVSTAVQGYLTPAQAGALDATAYGYIAEIRDGGGVVTQWEVGGADYTAAGTTLDRFPLLSSNANALVNFPTPPTVMLTILAEDMQSPYFSGHGRFGSTNAPTNTTDGDLTATRISIGNGDLSSTGSLLRFDGAVTATNSFIIYSNALIASSVTGVAAGYQSGPSTQAAAFALAGFTHFASININIGAGSSVGLQTGFFADAFSGSGSNLGFRGLLAAGANNWNLYMDGTAKNYLAGPLGVGYSSPTNTTAGDLTATRISIGNGDLAATGSIVRVGGNITGQTISYGHFYNPVILSDVTTAAYGILSFPSTQAASFTLGILTHFQASQGTIGASSAITQQIGFVVDANMSGASSANVGFRGQLAAAGGSWNVFMDGTARNYMQGGLSLGTTGGTDPGQGMVSTNQAGFILRSTTTITGGGTGNVPTLTAGPVTGNPTKWLPYDDNGTTRYIPSW